VDDKQEAARCHHRTHGAHQPVGVVVGGDQVQQRCHEHRDRLAEVERPARLREDVPVVENVGQHEPARALRR